MTMRSLSTTDFFGTNLSTQCKSALNERRFSNCRFDSAQRPELLRGEQISIIVDVERSRDDKCNVIRMGNNFKGCGMGTNPGRRAESRRHIGIVVSASPQGCRALIFKKTSYSLPSSSAWRWGSQLLSLKQIDHPSMRRYGTC